MLKNNLSTKIINNPIKFAKNVLYKIIIGPIKYKRGDDYDAKNYWHNRLKKYQHSIIGVGDESLTKKDNDLMYQQATKIFTNLLKQIKFKNNNINVLDIGCGTGFYTKIMKDFGVNKYTGIDITDILFQGLQKQFPNFNFKKQDITTTTNNLNDTFDLVIIIDVIEHIINEEKLKNTLTNINNHLSSGGVLMISPINKETKKHLFYVKSWSLKDIKKYLPNFIFNEPVLFRDASLVVATKQ